MRFVTILKVLSTLVVMVVLACTAMLTWHVTVEPLDGVFGKFIPDPAGVGKKRGSGDVSRVLDGPKVPDADPGEHPFRRASDLLAMGKTAEARERMTALINSFPTCASAPKARKILGEMNLDELLSVQMTPGKEVYRVTRGDSYLGIAARYQTTLEAIFHLNSMLEMRGLRPGDELLVMPLNFRLLIEPKKGVVSLWDEGRFLYEYPLLKVTGQLVLPARATEIEAKSAVAADGGRVLPGTAGYATATKVIQLKQPALRILGWDGEGVPPGSALVLRSQDMEELNLLVRKGNTVEFR